MADEYATAYADPVTNGNGATSITRQDVAVSTPPDNPKPGLWAYIPFEAPAKAQVVNDLAVEHLLVRPLNRLDEGLKQARYKVKAAAFAAQTLLFREL